MLCIIIGTYTSRTIPNSAEQLQTLEERCFAAADQCLAAPFGQKVINMKKKLYVGNLSFQTTETELKELFAQSGPVETVHIITDRATGQSKGFGFVEMEEGGDHAIAQLNGKEFKGRSLSVNEAKPMGSRPSGDGFRKY